MSPAGASIFKVIKVAAWGQIKRFYYYGSSTVQSDNFSFIRQMTLHKQSIICGLSELCGLQILFTLLGGGGKLST